MPWSCAFDVLEDPATITCMPAYLQLSTAPGARQCVQAALPAPLAAMCYDCMPARPAGICMACISGIFTGRQVETCTICASDKIYSIAPEVAFL